MDLEAAIEQQRGVNAAAAEAKGEKLLYVMPFDGVTPDDGLLKYAQVTSVYDFQNIADRTVVMFDEKDFDVLSCVVANQGLFNLNLVVLVGVPQADYTVTFDGIVWSLERVSYAPFLSELSIALEAEKQRVSSEENQYDREKKHYTRASGSVKKHNALLFSDVALEEENHDTAEDVPEGEDD